MVLETLIKADDLLDHLNKEDEQESRKITQVNPCLDDLCRKYEEWTRSSQCECEAQTIIGDSKFSAKEIQEFLIQRNKLEANAGYFISTLINLSPDTDFIIDLRHLDSQLRFLGTNNTKNIIFSGPAVYQMGERMISGVIQVNGNAESFLGYKMEGGEIIVSGNVGKFCGHSMKEGKIKIYGDAADWLGQEMEGGEIFLYGKYKSLVKDHSGNIYQKRRLFPGWRKLR